MYMLIIRGKLQKEQLQNAVWPVLKQKEVTLNNYTYFVIISLFSLNKLFFYIAVVYYFGMCKFRS